MGPDDMMTVREALEVWAVDLENLGIEPTRPECGAFASGVSYTLVLISNRLKGGESPLDIFRSIRNEIVQLSNDEKRGWGERN